MNGIVEGMLVRVLPPKPEWRDDPPSYIEEMDEYAGKVYKVAGVLGRFVTLDEPEGYEWHQDWLAPVFNED